ncbi:hypothetical protein FALBO_2835 [Fusarium albosuccineum]|uniref:Alcohol acetyltransferase n=1 Tax=Fusarium albosuccineum TaxID=1237068 RepID=A0A8H4PGH8_9HYPO|nr:hypothetical protein FALBO_2835 [Fusarium albosuccineum]
MSKPAVAQGMKPRVIRKLGHFCLYNIPENLRAPADYGKLVEVVELAVTDTLNQHPLLQVGLGGGAGTRRPVWTQLDELDLANLIEWHVVGDSAKYDEMHKEFTIRQLDTKFDKIETQPGWRLAVLKLEYANVLEVMFIWDHTNSDGTGGKIFHQTLLQSLNSVASNTDRTPLENHICKTTASTEHMVPPQEAVAKFRITPGYAAATVWKELKPPMFASKTAFVSWAPITLTPRTSPTCRSNGTTLTAVLHGIVFMSLCGQLPADKVAAMSVETPIDLRRYIKPDPAKNIVPHKLIGNYVTKLDHEFERNWVQKIQKLAAGVSGQERFAALEQEMWSAAVFAKGEIHDKVALGLKNDAVGLMGVVTDWNKYQRDELKKPRSGSWLVTNLGVIDGQPEPKESGWSIERSKFTLSANVLSGMFVFSAVTVKGKGFFIDLSWQDHILDAKIAEKLIADVEEWLKYIAGKV